jgi:hypothetical protein
MANRQRQTKSLGEDQAPPCPNCRKPTSLTRRPEPDYNIRYLGYERQVFTCPACGQQTERIVDASGHPDHATS